MLAKTDDRTRAPVDTDDFTADEIAIFSRARKAGEGLRRSWDQWLAIGEAILVARRHANTGEGGTKTVGLQFYQILKDQGLGWITITGRSAIRYLTAIMGNRDAVDPWRSTLSDAEKTKWSSPHAIHDRCPAFGQTAKQPTIKAKPMTVNELLRMTGTAAAQLLLDRNPSKAWALKRALDQLLDESTKPKHGWRPIDRERTAA
jgi:hypothetical protein